MENNKKIRLEHLESIDNTMSLDKLIQANDTQEPIIGLVSLWDSQKKEFKVNLGNGFTGYLPLQFSTVYPFFTEDEMLNPSLRKIIGKPIVVNVKYIDIINDTSKITLSRKENMQTAFEYLSTSVGEIVECCVKAFSKFGIFVDAGNGISGLIHRKDLSIPHLYDYTQLGFDIGDEITAKVISVDAHKYQVKLSYKDQFENLALKLNHDDLIEATVLTSLNDEGCFAYLNPNTPAVIDFPEDVYCIYGSKVIAKVKGTRTNNPNELKLTFVSFIE